MKTCWITARKIARRIGEGFFVDEDTRRILERSFGFQEPGEWLIMDESGPDSQQASALDLVVFPEIRFQKELEPHLLYHSCDPAEESGIVSWLTDQHLNTRILFSGNCFRMPFPPFLISGFVRRLRLTFQMDPGLAASIQRILPESLAWEVCVMIRNLGISWLPSHVKTMEPFLVSYFQQSDGWMLSLADLLACIGEGGIGPDLVAGLKQKREIWISRFYRAEQASRMKENTSAEILMMAGNRILSVTPEEADHHIQELDRILFRMEPKSYPL